MSKPIPIPRDITEPLSDEQRELLDEWALLFLDRIKWMSVFWRDAARDEREFREVIEQYRKRACSLLIAQGLPDCEAIRIVLAAGGPESDE